MENENGIQLAKAYVQIIPTTKGIQSNLSSALGLAGEEAGKAGGKGIASGIGKVAGGIAKVAAKGIAAASSGMATFAVTSVNAGKEFDSAMSQVAATMGKSTDEIQDLRAFAQEMGASTAFSATQAAEALNYMALAGYDADKSMEMLPTVLDLAASGGIDLAYASDMVTDASSALGLEMEDTTLLVDQMAKTASTTNTSVAQLGEAILTIGGTAKTMRGGTTELASVLGVLADNGIKGAEGGTHLRNMLLKLASPTKEGAAALETLGVQVFDAQGQMRSFSDIFPEMQASLSNFTDEAQLAMLSDIFNARDIAAAQALLGTTTQRWNTLADAIDGAWVTAEGLASGFEQIGYDSELLNLDSLVSSFTSLGISAEDAGAILRYSGGDAETFADMLLEAADAGVTMDDVLGAMPIDLDELQMAFDEAGGAAKQMAGTQLDNLSGDITLFKSALEGAQIAVSDQLTPSLRDFVKFGAEGLQEVTTAFKEGGLDGAIESLGGIVSRGVQMILEKLPVFVKAGSKLLKGIVQGIVAALPTITAALPEMLSAFLDICLEIANGIVTVLPAIMQAIAQALPVLLPQLITGIVSLITTLATHIHEIIGPILQALPDIINAIVVGLVQNLPALIAGIGLLIVGVLESVWDLLVSIWDSWIGPALEWLGNLFASIWEGISAFFQEVWDGIMEVWGPIATWINDTIIQPVIEFFAGLWNWLVETISSVVESIRNFFAPIVAWFNEHIIQPITKFFRNAWENIKKGVSSFITGVKNFFKPLVTWINQYIIGPISRFFSNLWEGIKTGLRAMLNGMIWILNRAIDGINIILAPLRAIIMAVGNMFGAGWSMGDVAIPHIPQLATGGIVTGPQLVMAGEAGAEAIIPLERNTEWIQRVAAEIRENDGGGGSDLLDAVETIAERLDRLQIVLDGDRLVGGISERMDRALGANQGLAQRGVATA